MRTDEWFERRILIVMDAEVMDRYDAVIGQPRVWQPGTGTNASTGMNAGGMQQQRNAYGGAPAAQVEGYGSGGGNGANLATEPPRASGGGYGGGAPAAQGQYRRDGGAVARNEQPRSITPIHALNPYQNRWTIRARITTPLELRSYSNAKGEGKVLGFQVLDADGTEIKCVCFNDTAVRLAGELRQGSVYEISKGAIVTPRDPRYAIYQYEIKLDNHATFVPCPDAERDIKKMVYKFKKLSELDALNAGDMVDVIGIAYSVGDLTTIMKRDGSETSKRSVMIRDDSDTSIEFTLWDPHSVEIGGQIESLIASGEKPVIAVKSSRLGEFQGKNMGTVSSTMVEINPDSSEATRMRVWFDQGGADKTFNSLSGSGGGGGKGSGELLSFSTVKEIGEELVAKNEGVAYLSCCGIIKHIKLGAEGNFYPACPLLNGERTCQKKLRKDDSTGEWMCERHAGEKIEAADWRYMFSMVCMDHSDEYWVSVFGDKGDKIFGISAAEMKEIYDREPERYENMISDALFNDYSLRVKVAVDNYNDVPRAKGSLVEIERVNYVDMSKKLIGKIAKLHAGEEPEVYVPPTKKRASDVGYGQENKMPAFNGGWNQAGGQANGGGASAANAANATCYKCGQTGHFAAACPSGGGGGGGASYNQFNGNGGGGGFNNNAPKKGACHKCGGEGHWARDCPNATYMGNGNGGNQPVHNGNGYGGGGNGYGGGGYGGGGGGYGGGGGGYGGGGGGYGGGGYGGGGF